MTGGVSWLSLFDFLLLLFWMQCGDRRVLGVDFLQKLFSCRDGYGIQAITGCDKKDFVSKECNSVILKI